MQQATTTTTNNAVDRTPSPEALDLAPGAEIRVVSPVGGRDGWGGVDAGPAPKRLMNTSGGARDKASRDWLRGYLVETLNREDRILMILYYFEGLNTREIGAVVDDTEASVIGRLHALNRDLQVAFEGFRREQSGSD